MKTFSHVRKYLSAGRTGTIVSEEHCASIIWVLLIFKINPDDQCLHVPKSET